LKLKSDSDENFEDGKPHVRLMNIIIGTCNFFMRFGPGEKKPNCRLKSSTLTKFEPSLYVPCSRTVIETEKNLHEAAFFVFFAAAGLMPAPRSVALQRANLVAVLFMSFLLRCRPARHDARLNLVLCFVRMLTKTQSEVLCVIHVRRPHITSGYRNPNEQTTY